MKREIIKIDEDKCTGCGACIPECHEGALQLIDGKARLISDLMCDGLGACIGHCPEGAITIEEREAEAYSEVKVMEIMVTKGVGTVVAHLKHLKEHNETEFMKQGINYLKAHEEDLSFKVKDVMERLHGNSIASDTHEGGCPGSKAVSFAPATANSGDIKQPYSELTQWPVQLHLVNPAAQYFVNSDLLVAADCTAFSMGNFHQKWLKGKSLVIACPKLDQEESLYLQKMLLLIEEAKVNTITVLIMEVPCCSGLLNLVQSAAKQAKRKVPVKSVIVGIRGNIISEEWV